MNHALKKWLVRLENSHHQEIQLGLTRVMQVARLMNLLDTHARVISVAGTNGKGSTVALLESIYISAGYSVASFSSPHLQLFNERIKINQQMISDADLVLAFEQIELARGVIDLTYFEMTTLAALWYFKQHLLDLVILEVGLGGRLDATNIMDADLSIITTVDIDHEAYLGNTIEAIGYEKAGIIRSQKPFIYADQYPPQSIVNKALELKAVTYWNGRDYHGYQDDTGLHVCIANQWIDLPNVPFHPHSVWAATMAVHCLQVDLPVNHEQLTHGVMNTRLAGRLQWIDEPRRTLLDVAHNPQAARYLATKIADALAAGSAVHAVFAAFKDKDIVGLVKPMAKLVTNWYPATLPSPRSPSSLTLMSALTSSEVKALLCYNDPVLAYQAACSQASGNDLIVVYGSFMTVGLVLNLRG